MKFNPETGELQNNNGFCTNCGKSISGYGKFCGFCGAKLITPDNKKTTIISNENILEAIYHNNLALVKKLILSEVNLNQQGKIIFKEDTDDYGESYFPLEYAFYCNRPEIEMELINSGANVNFTLDGKEAFFTYYIWNSHSGRNREKDIKLLEACFKVGANVNELYLGQPLIYWYSLFPEGINKLFLKTLINYGANVNFIDKYSSAGFFRHFMFDEYYDIFKMLLNCDIDINGTDVNGETALSEFLKRQLNNHNFSKHPEKFIKDLIDAGVNVNQKIIYYDIYSYPIHTAARGVNNSDLNILILLLEAGAWVNERDHNGETALSIAKGNNKKGADNNEMIKLLKQYGANEI